LVGGAGGNGGRAGLGGDGGTAGPGGQGGTGGDALGGDLYAVQPAAVVSLDGTAVINGSVHAGAAGLGGNPGTVGIGGLGGAGGAAGVGGTGSPVGAAGLEGATGGYGLNGPSSTMGQDGTAGVAHYTDANLVATATQVTSNHHSAIAGQPLTFTVKVTDTSGAPTGSVEFFDGSTDVGAASEVAVGHDSATFTFTTSQLPPGTHSIQAVFTGTGNFLDSSGSLTEKIHAVTTPRPPAGKDTSKVAAAQTEPIDPTTVIDRIFGEAGGESLAERLR
jgi:hypothetical protein